MVRVGDVQQVEHEKAVDMRDGQGLMQWGRGTLGNSMSTAPNINTQRMVVQAFERTGLRSSRDEPLADWKVARQLSSSNISQTAP
jgi:hypothetical protein